MYIVGFNGPPRSGKDTMARMLAEHLDSKTNLPVREVSLSTPLRKIAYAMTGFQGGLDGSEYEAFKIAWFPQFDRTGRQLMIDVSESFLKPVYGEPIMAELLLEELKDFDGIVLIRDTGFQVEVDALAKLVGYRKIYIARIHRANCDFSADSREWVKHPFSLDYLNDGTLDDLRQQAVDLFASVVSQGWAL